MKLATMMDLGDDDEDSGFALFRNSMMSLFLYNLATTLARIFYYRSNVDNFQMNNKKKKQ